MLDVLSNRYGELAMASGVPGRDEVVLGVEYAVYRKGEDVRR